MSDANWHLVLSGEQYAEVSYSQKQDQKKRTGKYQCSKKQLSVYIHVTKVFVTNVSIKYDLYMELGE